MLVLVAIVLVATVVVTYSQLQLDQPVSLHGIIGIRRPGHTEDVTNYYGNGKSVRLDRAWNREFIYLETKQLV